ncbi:carboxymuconolactone decarboxylase family protein [Rhodococcus koreensis]|uniref:carboxymuconolactone decarboxylase family protein n=1 Tax=Rhodococcus koreensis TaxID=99653 RepID=UPI0019804E9C|nr:carboxymuconolactone decarboxylase family protein [Rhodococcus koreensis]QSE86726.1 carboxymuconolactone decarboxylase family protein [Rhodococcus koreensis]
MDIDAVTGGVGEILRSRPTRLNIVATMAHATSCVVQQLALGRAVMKEQTLSPRYREMLILLAARLNRCDYVWIQHRAVAEQCGVSAPMVGRIEALDLSHGVFDRADRALLAFGRQVISVGEVEDEVFERVSRYLTAEELVEAIVAIGYYMTMNRIATVARTPLEPGTDDNRRARPGQ